jgi:hypothetical protein
MGNFIVLTNKITIILSVHHNTNSHMRPFSEGAAIIKNGLGALSLSFSVAHIIDL